MTSPYPRKVTIVEVGPRDGLQNEKGLVPVDDKVRLIEGLVGAGLPVVEAGSFVAPKWVPQMADTDKVFARIPKDGRIAFPVLVPNRRGLDGAVAAGATYIAIFAAATDGFSQANLNAPKAESLARFVDVIRAARDAGLRVRGYISCAVHCPYEGWVDPAAVADLAAHLLHSGCSEVSLCDTTGAGTPRHARALMEATLPRVPEDLIAVHFHDTFGQALANTLVCLEHGVATVDAAVAGLGGCPYSPGAAGNLATEDLVYMLDGLGIETGVDLERLAEAGRSISAVLGREPRSQVSAALAARARRGLGLASRT